MQTYIYTKMRFSYKMILCINNYIKVFHLISHATYFILVEKLTFMFFDPLTDIARHHYCKNVFLTLTIT